MIAWGLILSVPLLAYGILLAGSPAKVRAFNQWFEASRHVAAVLTVVAWFWTAYELDTIGIDVFDAILKRFTGEVWFLAALLSYLTYIWMPKNLSVRALTALLMLFPASLFRTTRLLLPESGAGIVHVFIVFAYIAAVVGMYGMFYPWRLEKGLAIFEKTDARARTFAAVLLAAGAALFVSGFLI